ncbi:uncharacterized protein LOC141599167 isoform X2 [Silene latifolia]|uniref:uncharacterized protein LOC141599167 isoform X2 n=1 Tax=Silene latifolia TaxID=37657 RepID=UPI003D773DD8
MSSNSHDAMFRRLTMARIDFQEKKFEKLKLKHLGCDVERRRLERKLELKNDENEELKRELGFLKDANARAIERYVLTSGNNRQLEAELGELKAAHLACDFERRRLERELEFKNDKLEDLTKELRFSKDVKAKANVNYVKGLEYDREVEAKVDELRRGFNDERAKLWGKLNDLEVKSKNVKYVYGNLRYKFGIVFERNEQVEIGRNSKADPVCDSEISDSDDVESSFHVGGLRRARASSVCAIRKHIDDSSSGASDHLQHPRQPIKRFFVKSEYQTVIVEGEIPLTIDSLKSKIEDKMGIPRHQQCIVLEEEHVIDHTFAHHNNNKEPPYPIRTHLSVYRDMSYGDDDDRTWVVDTSYGLKEVSVPDEPDFYAGEYEQYKRELQEQEQLHQEEGDCS